MKLLLVTIFIFSLVFDQCSSVQLSSSDVYWREYTGIVPDDAVPGGYDVNKKNTFIGQAFVKDNGIIPGVIYYGANQMTVPSYGTKIVDTCVKILCSSHPKNAFKWLQAKANNLHSVINNRYVVKGGEENGFPLYIGRVAYQGEVITGKILPGTPGEAPLYFAHKNKEIKINSYEVLVYDPSAFKKTEH